ncbi:hypothetical protein HK102_003992 [Quaeritorhiza haematococci]|nr:hypothetical protein HK102_003992 [Quaeritorhiza haematococci]
MKSDTSKQFYERFLERLRTTYGHPSRVKDGVFGAMMSVNIVNEGPVTILLDSRDTKKSSSSSSSSSVTSSSASLAAAAIPRTQTPDGSESPKVGKKKDRRKPGAGVEKTTETTERTGTTDPAATGERIE